MEVSQDIWDTVIPMLNSLLVRTVPTHVHVEDDDDSDMSSCEGGDEEAKFYVKTDTGKTLVIAFDEAATIGTVKDMIQDIQGILPDEQRLIWAGRQLEDSKTLWEYGIGAGTTLHLIRRLRGGKPVIYLLPPTNINATVKLSLRSEWDFSAVYPTVPLQNLVGGGQTLQWNVHAAPDGTLFESNTGLEVSYLFWEAEALKATPEPLSPLASPAMKVQELGVSEIETFIPNQPRIDGANSVVLQVEKVPHYLDASLKSLGLHTEARTSFITYWLPSILKHKSIALRFLPQVAYEKSAPLAVTPAPDVTVRIFMLFRGLKDEELVDQTWGRAVEKSNKDVNIWRDIVGVDQRSLDDKTLFRVVEWGGMEVL